MRKFLALAIVALIGLTAIMGCKPKKTVLPDYGMTATIAGNGFSAGECWAVPTNGMLSIMGSQGNSSVDGVPPLINILIPNWNGAAGTTVLGLEYPSIATAIYMPSTGNLKYSATGSVTITSLTRNEMTGIFHFTTADTQIVSNGSFIAEIK